MKDFWKGFCSIFSFNVEPIKIPKIEPFEWYHKGNWWEHPLWKRDYKND